MVEYILKPCPFCGDNPNIVSSDLDHFREHIIECGNCPCSMITFEEYDLEEGIELTKLVRKWNTREE